MEIDSKPESMDKLDRKLVQLKIERMALKKEKDKSSKKRLEALQSQIEELEKEYSNLDEIWKKEKSKVQGSQHLKEEIEKACLDVVRQNNLQSCYIRPIAFYGSEKMGVSPKGATVHVSIAAWPWGAYLGAEGIEKGIRVKTSSFSRHHVNVTMCRAKYSGTYANSILANQEAIDHGYDEALLLDVDGFVAEGAGENLFIVKNNTLYEPELTSALMGITRDTVLTLASESGINFKSKRLTRDDVYTADEAFFTGTAAEVTPIRELDNRKIGLGERGPVTQVLQEKFFDIVNGKSSAYERWLTYV